MKQKASIYIILVSISLLAYWTSPACARLYPPCQDIGFTQDSVDSIRYWVTDPVSLQVKEETWTVPLGDERFIQSVQLDQGILTWIARYRYSSSSDPFYTFDVQVRIYDPGRGVWRKSVWVPFDGDAAAIEQHQVKDGVVAWITRRYSGGASRPFLEHRVYCATYDPEFGSFVLNVEFWEVSKTSKYSPEVLRVKNGVVAWPMNNAESGKASDEQNVTVYYVTYDQELHQWKPDYRVECIDDLSYSFDWILIVGDAAQVQARCSYMGNEYNEYAGYNPNAHYWIGGTSDYSYLSKKAYFVAQPKTGVVPFRVWFWDCSTAMEGIPQNSIWDWVVEPGVGLNGLRSPSYRYTSPGQYTVTEFVKYSGFNPPYTATAQINAQAPAPPAGGIFIKSPTNSVHVNLVLGFTSSAKEMCFRQSPGMISWSNWEPVAPSKQWTLSKILVAGESPDGFYNVSVKFRDQYGTESQEYQDWVYLDLTPPAVVLTLNNGATKTNNPNVQAFWSATDNYTLEKMWMTYTSFNEEDAFTYWSLEQRYYEPQNKVIPFSSKAGKKTTIVRFRDVAGNTTQIQETINFIPPIYLPLILKN
jgi:hypothetical protein